MGTSSLLFRVDGTQKTQRHQRMRTWHPFRPRHRGPQDTWDVSPSRALSRLLGGPLSQLNWGQCEPRGWLEVVACKGRGYGWSWNNRIRVSITHAQQFEVKDSWRLKGQTGGWNGNSGRLRIPRGNSAFQTRMKVCQGRKTRLISLTVCLEDF